MRAWQDGAINHFHLFGHAVSVQSDYSSPEHRNPALKSAWIVTEYEALFWYLAGTQSIVSNYSSCLHLIPTIATLWSWWGWGIVMGPGSHRKLPCRAGIWIWLSWVQHSNHCATLAVKLSAYSALWYRKKEVGWVELWLDSADLQHNTEWEWMNFSEIEVFKSLNFW